LRRPFLAQLIGEPADVYVDQERSSAPGSLDRTAWQRICRAHRSQVALSSRNGLGQPHVFVLKSELDILPGETRALRLRHA
jgi:hypothetical protein